MSEVVFAPIPFKDWEEGEVRKDAPMCREGLVVWKKTWQSKPGEELKRAEDECDSAAVRFVNKWFLSQRVSVLHGRQNGCSWTFGYNYVLPGQGDTCAEAVENFIEHITERLGKSENRKEIRLCSAMLLGALDIKKQL